MGVGGGVTESQRFTTKKLANNDYVATIKFSASAKIGVGESVGKGVDINGGLNLGTK